MNCSEIPVKELNHIFDYTRDSIASDNEWGFDPYWQAIRDEAWEILNVVQEWLDKLILSDTKPSNDLDLKAMRDEAFGRLESKRLVAEWVNKNTCEV
ncbi:MAG: hypothetical protein JW829_01020 [Pirellulales bacterium]|nr:hypothetical protein [Pirellulales bacterium]